MINVAVRYSKAVAANPADLARLERPMALAVPLAAHVHRRVAAEADPATTPEPRKGRRGYVVSKAYAHAVGLDRNRFGTSDEFHRAAGSKFGTFRVSGGMWAGLGVRNVGSGAALLAFFGSSLGGGKQAGKTATGRERLRPVRVRNQVKAGTVFKVSRVNVIQPKDGETLAMVGAVARWSQVLIMETLGAEGVAFHADGDQRLLGAILRGGGGAR